jgi:hypothetical protein
VEEALGRPCGCEKFGVATCVHRFDLILPLARSLLARAPRFPFFIQLLFPSPRWR